ncbi:MAG: iron-sulfur cluster assembly protein, partial [Planctomycetota bacterium]|nr:iron-sulfur cluster assembly protein [Planctomycetota bacterium]
MNDDQINDDSNSELQASDQTGDSASASPANGSLETETGLTEEQVREALKEVIDPELFVNIVDLGLIYTV